MNMLLYVTETVHSTASQWSNPVKDRQRDNWLSCSMVIQHMITLLLI